MNVFNTVTSPHVFSYCCILPVDFNFNFTYGLNCKSGASKLSLFTDNQFSKLSGSWPLWFVIAYKKIGPQCVLVRLCLVLFHLVGFCLQKSVSGSLIPISKQAITAKITVLLWNWRHCIHGRKLVPLGRILDVKPNKRDRLVWRLRLKTKSAVLECPINKIVLWEASRFHQSS